MIGNINNNKNKLDFTGRGLFFPSKELIQPAISLGPGALGWIYIISVSSVSFGVQLSMRPNAPNILEGHFPYLLPPGRFIPHHLTRWEHVLFLKASREDASSKRWEDRAMPYAAFPVELIGQVSDLHGVYLAPSSPTGLNRSRKKLWAQHTFRALWLFCFDYFSDRETPSAYRVKSCFRISVMPPASPGGSEPHSLTFQAAPHKWPRFTQAEESLVTFHHTLPQCIYSLTLPRYPLCLFLADWKVSSTVLSLCGRRS